MDENKMKDCRTEKKIVRQSFIFCDEFILIYKSGPSLTAGRAGAPLSPALGFLT